jgi:type I restriction enzyme R subunit
MKKKELSERDIISKYVLPALTGAGWDLQSQIFEEYTLTPDRITARGRDGQTRVPGTGKRADIVLCYKPNLPVAVIEAKDNNHPIGGGMGQALGYAELMDLPIAYSTNGDAFLESDRTGAARKIERDVPLGSFPAPAELWRRYCAHRGISAAEEPVAAQGWYLGAEDRTPRYYQIKAVNLTVEAIANGQPRILLVMATGTGKTYTAFQIIWRLWKAREKKRVLFLADRNILVDQARNNDFQPFGQALTKIEHRMADKSFEIYLALYQAVTGTEDVQNIYKQFSPGFFDLVVVDECHRGSAAEDSAWRDILTYFGAATQIGMTATPKETDEVSNIHYFGDPIFTYSLKQGIEDGFLAPYKVIRIESDKDQGYTPGPGKRDKYGQLVKNKTYKRKDLDRTLVLEQRTELVARKVTEYLGKTDPYAKTIVFCQDIEHAERMRSALVNENRALCLENRRYVCRITGEDPAAKHELDDFILPGSRYPVIATTSKLLTTGVDAQTCKLIVIDQEIGSMTEFKQIIGRGTRVREDYGKLWFTIMDFRGATRHFEDEDFDGPAEQVYEPKEGDPIVPPDDAAGGSVAPPSPRATTRGGSRSKLFIADEPVGVLSEQHERYGADGKRVEVSATEHARAVLRTHCASLDELRRRWLAPEERGELLGALARNDVAVLDLAEAYGEQYGTYDLLAHAGFAAALVTRGERARGAGVAKVVAGYGDLPRRVLEGLLADFEGQGFEMLADADHLKRPPHAKLGTLVELVKAFGGRAKFEKAVAALEAALYGEA